MSHPGLHHTSGVVRQGPSPVRFRGLGRGEEDDGCFIIKYLYYNILFYELIIKWQLHEQQMSMTWTPPSPRGNIILRPHLRRCRLPPLIALFSPQKRLLRCLLCHVTDQFSTQIIPGDIHITNLLTYPHTDQLTYPPTYPPTGD